MGAGVRRERERGREGKVRGIKSKRNRGRGRLMDGGTFERGERNSVYFCRLQKQVNRDRSSRTIFDHPQ